MNLKVQFVITDLDGVMTDGGLYYTESGERFKKFNVYDFVAFQLLKDRGILTAAFYSSESPIMNYVAKDMGIQISRQNVKDKHQMAKELCKEEGLSLNKLAFIGDDTNDIPLMNQAGLAACPPNAPKAVRDVEDILILKKNGGDGVLREFTDYILSNEFY